MKSLLQWVVAGLEDLDHKAAQASSASFEHAVASPLFPSYRLPDSSPLTYGSGPGSPPLEPAKQAEVQGPSTGGEDEDPTRGIGLGQGFDTKLAGDSTSDTSR